MQKLINLRLARLLLAALLLCGAATLAFRPVQAQSVARCQDYNFPQSFEGWQVLAGTIINTGAAFNVVTSNLTRNPVYVELNFPEPVYVTSIQIFTYQNALTTGFRQVNTILYDAGINYVTSRVANYNDTGVWTLNNVVFPIETELGRPISKIEFDFNSVIGYTIAADAGIHIGSICIVPVGDPGPTATGTVFVNSSLTPVIPTYTPSLTRTPTNTPTPSNTFCFLNGCSNWSGRLARLPLRHRGHSA